MLALAEQDALPHFALDPARLDDAADYVAAVTRQITRTSQSRITRAGGISKPAGSTAGQDWRGSCTGAMRERWRGCASICAPSAYCWTQGPALHGAIREPTPDWCSSDRKGLRWPACMRSVPGCFPAIRSNRCVPMRTGLVRISDADLAVAFQVAPDNPLPGVAGRAALLRSLGAGCYRMARIGGLLEIWQRPQRCSGGSRRHEHSPGCACANLARSAQAAGENLGDVWPHPGLPAMAWYHSTNCRNG